MKTKVHIRLSEIVLLVSATATAVLVFLTIYSPYYIDALKNLGRPATSFERFLTRVDSFGPLLLVIFVVSTLLSLSWYAGLRLQRFRAPTTSSHAARLKRLYETRPTNGETYVDDRE